VLQLSGTDGFNYHFPDILIQYLLFNCHSFFIIKINYRIYK
jgi:hypothetical protein